MTNNQTSKRNWTIYSLDCPIDNSVRYIGITSRSPRQRLKEHFFDSKKTNPYKWAWIKSLKRKGLKPAIRVLEKNLTEKEACEKEKEIIVLYRSADKYNKITNLHEGGNLPPLLFGNKNPNTNFRKILVWKKTNVLSNNIQDSGVCYIFDYISEGAKFLNVNPNGMFKALSGKYKTIKGFYVCYLDEIDSWEKPIDKRYKIKSFKIWNDKNEWFFNTQTEAIKTLNLNSVNLSQALSGKRNKVGGYYTCYADQLNKWKKPKIKKGKRHRLSKKKKFKVWNDKNEEYIFEYINEAIKSLKLKRRNLQFVLDGGAYKHKGYYACYVDKLSYWISPDERRKKYKKILNKPIEVEEILTKQRYRYENINQAVKDLKLHRSHFKNVLFGNLKSHKGYTITFVGYKGLC